MPDNELGFKSGRELAALIKSKKVSPVEVVGAYLDRIERLNPKVRAFITILRDEAMQKARQAEEDIRRGKYIGPLHGLPYAPKDIVTTTGHRTTNNSDVTKDNITNYESTVTERLNRAGAIMVGKLALSPFALGSAIHTSFGIAHNPWNLDYSAAGSSSGPGAALAAYMIPLSLGTDTGGSIRGPANADGIVGFKPTYGRVSRYGVTTLSWTLDHVGPMTKTVADNADMLQVLAGYDPKDPSSTREPVPDYSKALTRNVKGLRIGVPSSFFEDTHPEVDKSVRAAIQKFVDMGTTVVDVEIPHEKYGPAAWTTIMLSEAACFHEKRLKEKFDLFDPLLQEQFSVGKFCTATDYIKANRVRTLLMMDMAKVFEKCDFMAVPANKTLTGKIESPAVAASRVRPGPPAPAGNTNLGNMTGLPALVIPCGFSSNSPNLPIGIMFYGKPFDELTLFCIAHAYESVTDWHKRRPSLDDTGQSRI